MQVIMTTTNAYDSILLIDDDGQVVSRWIATPEVVADYLANGGDPMMWDVQHLDDVSVEDCGETVGRDGQIDDDGRRQYWEQTYHVALLRTAIDASGLSARKWAEQVAWRDERTIRRWLSGDSPIPALVVEKLRIISERR